MKSSLTASALGLLLTFSSSAQLTVHEWGTFTQVIGSDGTVLEGLEREEEALPQFVYGHYGLENGGSIQLATPSAETARRAFLPLHLNIVRKGSNRPVKGVTTKMETPVIYFYSDEAVQAEVDVKWHGGSISQWYPRRTSGETPPPLKPNSPKNDNDNAFIKAFEARGGIDFTKGYQGSVSWEIEVAAKNQFDQADLFKGNETVSWLHPRVPDASVVTSGSESEGYLFYRGIGQLDSGIHFDIDQSNTLTISNTLAHDVPFAMIFENDGSKVRSSVITNGVTAGTSLTIPDSDLTDLGAINTNWQSTVYRQMRAGLLASGLFQEEAEAMIQTWWSSYFAKPSSPSSVRVFWILPTAQVNEVLPLNITPIPEKTVRVLVGRAEVLRPSAERALMAMERNPQGFPAKIAHDRFALAYRNRINQLESSAKITP